MGGPPPGTYRSDRVPLDEDTLKIMKGFGRIYSDPIMKRRQERLRLKQELTKQGKKAAQIEEAMKKYDATHSDQIDTAAKATTYARTPPAPAHQESSAPHAFYKSMEEFFKSSYWSVLDFLKESKDSMKAYFKEALNSPVTSIQTFSIPNGMIEDKNGAPKQAEQSPKTDSKSKSPNTEDSRSIFSRAWAPLRHVTIGVGGALSLAVAAENIAENAKAKSTYSSLVAFTQNQKSEECTPDYKWTKRTVRNSLEDLMSRDLIDDFKFVDLETKEGVVPAYEVILDDKKTYLVFGNISDDSRVIEFDFSSYVNGSCEDASKDIEKGISKLPQDRKQ